MNRRLLRNRLAVLAFLVILGAAATAFLAPHLPLGDPDAVDTPNRLHPPLTAGHWLGTDEFGRDLLAPHLGGTRLAPRGRGHGGGGDADRGRARDRRRVL